MKKYSSLITAVKSWPERKVKALCCLPTFPYIILDRFPGITVFYCYHIGNREVNKVVKFMREKNDSNKKSLPAIQYNTLF